MPSLLDGIRAGGVVGFSGQAWQSDVINLATYGIPRWGISHVGIIAKYKGELLLFESTTFDSLPCVIQGKCFSGVQAHRLMDVLEVYAGRVWAYPLTRPLYPFEDTRLSEFLRGKIATPYDTEGALESAGWLSRALHGEDLHELFCSELVAAALNEIGLLPTGNASGWTPNRLVRRLVREEVVRLPRRLK